MAESRVLISRIWNRVINFGTEYGYIQVTKSLFSIKYGSKGIKTQLAQQ